VSARAARPRVEWRDVDGILLLDKPVGLSSNGALQRVRHLYRARKAGHTGSLDPLASGALPLCLGEATKVAGLLLEADKVYRAELVLGSRTATGDREGAVIERAPVPALAPATVARVLGGFVGEREQVPPMYSALKHFGEPLYALARRGETVERAARRIAIRRLQLLGLEAAALSIEVECSKGTYIRVLGEEIAAALGTCGHLGALHRTAVGGFAGQPLHDLAALEALEGRLDELDRLLLPVDAALGHLPAVRLAPPGAAAVRHGNPVEVSGAPGGTVRIYDEAGRFLGVGEVDAGRLAPRRLMAREA
jgi:tRNA pseudouridine55 synthase